MADEKTGHKEVHETHKRAVPPGYNWAHAEVMNVLAPALYWRIVITTDPSTPTEPCPKKV